MIGRAAKGLVVALLLAGAACGDTDPMPDERSLPIGGAVVAWLGDAKAPEAVSVGITLELRTRAAEQPDPTVLVPLLASAQRWVGSSFTDPAALFESRRTSPGGLMTAVSLELRDPRYRLAAAKLPWIVRGTKVTMSAALCPRPGQQMTAMATAGAPGVYLCLPIAPARPVTPTPGQAKAPVGTKTGVPAPRASRQPAPRPTR